MDDKLLEIRHYDGQGYRPLIDFGTWRVAVLRWEPRMQPENTRVMERHMQTDEVFVLLDGQATLILGGNSSCVDGVHLHALAMRHLYNVKLNTWHAVLLSRDASILIVEENNTGKANTEYCELTSDFLKKIGELSKI